MFLRGRKNRVGATVALAAVLAMALAAPAGAVPWGGFGEARELTSGLLPRVLAWLTPAPNPGILKCDGGATIDPNGVCHKASSVPAYASVKCDQGSTIDPNGGCHKSSGVPASRTGGMRADDGSRVAPAHRR